MKWSWLVTRLDGIGPLRTTGWRDACCPAHADNRASLGIKVGAKDDVVALKCHAGCRLAAILAALGVEPDQWNRSESWTNGVEIADAYDYEDEQGQLLFQVVRTNPKSFRQRRPDPTKRDGWAWDMTGVRRMLYRLPELQGQPVAYVVEGEKDVQALADLDLIATTNPGGAGKWHDEYTAQLVAAGVKTVICLPDHDPPGEAHAQAVARRCLAAGLTVKIVRLPDLPPKGDVSDWLEAGGTRDALLALVEATPELTAEALAGTDALTAAANAGRPLYDISLSLGDLKEAAQTLWAIIESHNSPPTLFRAATLAWVERDDQGAPFVRPLTPPRVTHWLAEHIYFYKVVDTKLGAIEVPTNPPGVLVSDMLATPEPPLPVLTRIVQTPIVAADGTLHETPGYDPLTRAWYAPAPGFAMRPVASSPTADEVKWARENVLEIFCNFPFVGDADRATVVAALLTLFVRDVIDGPVPLMLITKPSPGTGASLCASAIVLVATGHLPAGMTQCQDEDEWRKKITAVLLTGPAVILLDNLHGVLDSAQLSAALTLPAWKDRILGQSEMVSIPIRTIWLGTANNATLSRELVRRTVRAKFDAGVERPWLRAHNDFTHPDLLAWVKAERARLVHSCLTLVRAWFAQGCPPGQRSKGSYEQWARVLGGILDVADIPGLLTNEAALYDEQDVETEDTKLFLEVWWKHYGETAQTPRDLFHLADVEAIPLPLAGKDGHGRLASFGHWLRKQLDIPYEIRPDLTVEVVRATPKDSHRPLWKLVDAAAWRGGSGGSGAFYPSPSRARGVKEPQGVRI